MATRVRTQGSRMAPKRVQAHDPAPQEDDEGVKCTGHGRRCKRLVAGANSKNPGRAFYACPLDRDDPQKCKFFKWEDELQSLPQPQTPQKNFPAGPGARLGQGSTDKRSTLGSAMAAGPQALGQSPSHRFGKPDIQRTPAPAPAPAPGRRGRSKSDDIEELDWEKVDTESIEREAIASTPSSSQRTASQSHQTPGPSGGESLLGSAARDRLRAAVDEGMRKRKAEEDEGIGGTAAINASTPKRALIAEGSNPFIGSPTTTSPRSAVLSPILSSLDQVNDHLLRQERLIHAGEQMKQGLRKTILTLQEKNQELEKRVKELELRLANK